MEDDFKVTQMLIQFKMGKAYGKGIFNGKMEKYMMGSGAKD